MPQSLSDPSLLDLLLHDWRQLLSQWAQTGALSRAAVEALHLSEEPITLRHLVEGWQAGDFQDLPPVVALPGRSMPPAAGADAISTGTIVLNQEWLQSASREQVLAVLTEELGRQLAGRLNSSDTPGDEGELFAALLAGESLNDHQHRSIVVEADNANSDGNGVPVAVERAATVISTSIPVTSPVHATDQGGLGLEKAPTLSVSSPAISTQIVTTPQDISSGTDGFLSLREAIVQANTANEDGIIVLAEGRYTLATADDLDIQLQGKTLTIQGQGKGLTILDGNRLDRFFEVHSGANVVISGVTITNGRAPDGGAIFNSGSLSISDSAIENNQAVGVDGRPGLPGPDAEGFIGIKRKGGDGERGDNGNDGAGGAIYNNGTITITNTTIDNNQAKGGDGGRGGVGGQGQRFSLGWPIYYIGGLGGDGGVGGDGAIGRGGGIFNAGLATLANIVVGKHSVLAGIGGLAGPGGPGGQNFSGPLAPSGNPGRAGRSGFAFGEFIYNSGGILSDQTLSGIFDQGGFVELGNHWAVYLTVSHLSVTEDGETNLVYTFSRRGGLSNPLTVNYSVGGTAKLNTDYTQTGASTYTATAGTVTFTPGSSTATVTIDPTTNTKIESNKTVVLTLGPGAGYVLGGSSVQTGEITDDDSTVRLSVSPNNLQEDDSPNLTYTFTRSGNTSDALTVNYTVGGTATFDTDYSQIGGTSFSATSGSVTFAANADTAILTINPTTDTAIEPDETIALSLTSGSYKIGTTEALSRTIINDDASVSLAVSLGSVEEDGAQNLIYSFTRTGATANPLTVNYTVGGTATPNTDYTQSGANTYTATTGTITFAAESTTANITIDPTADTVAEPNETIGLTLAAGTGYTISTPSTITGSITDNDSTVTLAVSPGSATEDGTPNLIYTFTRSGDTTDELTVNYTVGGTAILDIDYNKIEADSHSATAGTATFAPGSATATVTINPTADTSIEPDETVALTLAAGSYKIGTTAAVTGTIVNDDTTVSLSVSPSSVAEDGPSHLVYTFTRAEATSIPLTVHYTVGGTALFDTDYGQTGAATYTETTGSVTFAVGLNTATVTIDPSADDSVEPNETVALSLTPGTGYVIGTSAPVVGTFTSLPGELIRTPTGASHPGSTHQEVRNGSAFAALKNDGSVVTWGDPANGGNSSHVASQLVGAVSQIISNYYAFSALKGDGSVVSWGDSRYGGNSSSVASQLSSGVTRMASTASAFAALKSNGSVVTWGNALAGGNSSAVASLLSSRVSKIFSTEFAFAALKADGSVVTWGNTSFGGNSSNVASQLASGVTQVFSNCYAFAALKADGSVVTWGESRYGGDSRSVGSNLASRVTKIFASEGAFAALKRDGSVVTWGDSRYGADSSSVSSLLRSGITQIFSNGYAFAALKSDGSVITWGPIGGNSSAVSRLLRSGVSQVFASGGAFAALKTNGSVVTWGSSSFGGNSSGVASQLASGVTRIVSTLGAFAALKKDGSLVIWGNTAYGGNNAGVASQLTSGVRDVFTSEASFAALKNDGSVVTWGPASSGGDSSAVATQLRSGVMSFADPFHDDRLVVPAGEPRITLAVSPTTGVMENGSANLIYTFSRTGPTTSALTVNYSVAGTASLGSDYTGIAATPSTKSITFAAGLRTATVSVNPTDDNTIEPNETVALTLAAGSGYTIGTTAAMVGTIKNDDPRITLAVAPATGVAEDGTSNLIYTFSRTGPTASALTVNYSVAGTARLAATATNPADYRFAGSASTATSRTVTFAAGAATATVAIDPTADTRAEANETVTLQLTAGTRYTIGTTAAVTGTIRNDDIIGTAANNILKGTAAADLIDGLAGTDTLTGLAGADRFAFRFSHSPLTGPDRLTDFAFASDKITLVSATGSPLPIPRSLSRAADNPTATTLRQLATSLFADANSALAGNQPLAANAAALVRSTNKAIAGTYLLINDNTAALSTSNDLLINLTGYSGTLPAIGTIAANRVFV